MGRILCMTLLVLTFLTGTPASAQGVKPEVAPSGLVVPRFVSLGVSRGNMRVGPSTDHPIMWQYQRRGLPLEILEEYQSWRLVRDVDGTTGWMHKQLLSGRRMAMVQGDWAVLREEPLPDARIIARMAPHVAVRLLECGAVWCEVDANDASGWVDRDSLWGLYDHEILE